MSVAAEILKLPFLRSARSRVHRPAASVIDVPVPAVAGVMDAPLELLLRRIFFSQSAPRRLLLAAAGAETNIGAFAQRAGETLARISGACVGLVEAETSVTQVIPLDPRERDWDHDESWRSRASQLNDRLWRIDAQVLLSSELSSRSVDERLPFDYLVVAGSANASGFHLLCNLCDAAVLVLTANKTRREAALHAARVLRQANVQLLGTVLEERRFPIPESIYRRL